MMRIPSIFITFLILVAWQQESLLVSSQVHFKKGAPHVKLANGGLISGIVKFSRDGRPYNTFIGIQYAKVPERFQEPVPLLEPTWQGVYSATKPGPMCPQSGIGDSSVQFGEEDCLNLNVYVPMNNTGTGKKGYPVLFWVHGGGYSFGGGLGYNPKHLMDEDLIVVTINYRLGAFGFLSTGDNVVPSNNGLKDMVVALKWVQENIQNFGGDPTKVTIVGESAGGSAVHFLLLSPTTKGLFQRAISQSGTALSPWAFDPNPKKSAIELATYLNCPTSATEPSGITSEDILTCLKGLTTEELNKAQVSFKTCWPPEIRAMYFGPSVEPADRISTLTPFMTEAPISILSRKDSVIPEIPWMVGATEDEGASMFAGIILSKPELLTQINSDWETVAPSTFDYGRYLPKDEQSQVSEKLKQFYFGGGEISTDSAVPLTNVYSDEMILHGVYRSAIETASRGKRNPVYLYQYAYKGPISFMGSTFRVQGLDENKVGHADDLQHLFDFGAMNPEDPLIKPDSPDEEFSKNFVRLWASFAQIGEPKHTWGNALYKKWKPISKKELDGITPLRWYRIDSNPESLEIDQSVKDRMQFWDNIWTDHLTPAHVKDMKTPQKTEL